MIPKDDDTPIEEVQSITQQVMGMLLLRLGRADLHCERCRLAAATEEATDRDRFLADLATRNLEVEVHRVIEFARGMAEQAVGSREEN